MAMRSWRTVLAIGCGVLGFGAAAIGTASAQEYLPANAYADAECYDDCDSGWCHRFSFCKKLKLHCAYSHRKCTRPYQRMNHIPPELAPYIGPGTWHSGGYGLPYGTPPTMPYGSAYGYGQ